MTGLLPTNDRSITDGDLQVKVTLFGPMRH